MIRFNQKIKMYRPGLLKKGRSFVYLAVLLLLGPIVAARSEEVRAIDERPVNFEETVRLPDFLNAVLTQNSEIKKAKAMWEAAKAGKIQAWALADPMVGFDLMGEMSESRVGPEENRMMVSQEIPFPLKLWERRQKAKEAARAFEYEYAAVVHEVTRRAEQAFYRLYYADASLDVLTEVQGLLKNVEGVAQAKYANRSGAQRDAAKAQAEVSMTLEETFSLEQERESAIAAMNQLLDRSPLLGFGRAEKVNKPILEKTLIELIHLGADHQPYVKAAEASAKEAKHGTRLARMENIPDLTAGFSYTWVGSGMTTEEEDGKDSWMFPLAFRVPLWQNRIAGAIREAKQEFEAAQANISVAKNETFYQIKDAYVKYQAATKIVTLYETAVLPQAELVLNSDRAGYESGQTDFLNLLDSGRVYLNAKLSYIRMYVELLKSFSDLSHATGVDLTKEAS